MPEQVVEDHTLEMIRTRVNSHTLLAFCGSQAFARDMHQIKISNDMITAMTGNCHSHVMEFCSDSYGGADSSEKKKQAIATKYGGDEDTMELLTNRKSVVMENPSNFEVVDSSASSFWI